MNCRSGVWQKLRGQYIQQGWRVQTDEQPREFLTERQTDLTHGTAAIKLETRSSASALTALFTADTRRLQPHLRRKQRHFTLSLPGSDLVRHPQRGTIFLLSTDVSRAPLEIHIL